MPNDTNKLNPERFTRSKTTLNPKLQQQLINPNKYLPLREPNSKEKPKETQEIFSRSRKTLRSPTRPESLPTISSQRPNIKLSISTQEESSTSYQSQTQNTSAFDTSLSESLDTFNDKLDLYIQNTRDSDDDSILGTPNLIDFELGEQRNKFFQENLINSKPNIIEAIQNNMDRRPQSVPVWELAKRIEKFDGNNYDIDEFISKVTHENKNVNDIDRASFLREIVDRLSGQLHKDLRGEDYENLDDLLNAIKEQLPEQKTYMDEYASMTRMYQEEDETVQSFHSRLFNKAQRILDLHAKQTNPNNVEKQRFRTEIIASKLNQFRDGLKFDIGTKMKEKQTYEEQVKEARNIEQKLSRLQNIKNSSDIRTKQVHCAFDKDLDDMKISYCQICREHNHEAFNCKNSACVYCKQKEHFSKDCNITIRKLKFACKYCSLPGHTIDNCKLNKRKGNFCQYCQVMGHEVCDCDYIQDFVICYKCKETDHDAFSCKKMNQIEETCDNCDKTGHSLRNCPTAVCSKCNQQGHTTKFCTISKNKPRFCFVCQEQGHMINECENFQIFVNAVKSPSLNKSTIICYKCQKPGHTARNCLLNISPQRIICENCKIPGHSMSSCWKIPGNRPPNKNQEMQVNQPLNRGQSLSNEICQLCYKPGHLAERCIKMIEIKIKAGQPACRYCREDGHYIENCTRRQDKNKGNSSPLPTTSA